MEDTGGMTSPIRELRRLYRDAEAKAARLRLIVDIRTMLDSGPLDTSIQEILSTIAGFSGATAASIRQEPDATWQFPVRAVFEETGKTANELVFTGKAWLGGEQVQLRLSGLATSLDEADRDAIQIVADQLATFLAAERQRVLRERLTRDLEARERELERLVKAMIGAQEQERRRVAYDLHDGLAQSLVSLLFRLEAAGVAIEETGTARQAIEGGVELVRSSIGEVRRAIADLRPAELDDLGLEAALRARLDDVEGTHVSFRSDLHGKRLPDVLEVSLYRVAQEALANAVKHSGCRRIDLNLASVDPQFVVLSVTDDGRGGADASVARERGRGVGMSAMRERMALIGGSLSIRSEPGKGTVVTAQAPVSVPVKDCL